MIGNVFPRNPGLKLIAIPRIGIVSTFPYYHSVYYIYKRAFNYFTFKILAAWADKRALTEKQKGGEA